jgi:hypothetical protein
MSTGDPICSVCGNYKLNCTCSATLRNLMNLNELKYKAAKISDETFGAKNPVSAPILKLVEEIGELLECFKNGTDPQVEFADCFLLLVDSYRKYYGDNVDMQTLIDVSSEKLDVIARRKWGKPNEHGVYKHISDEEPKRKKRNKNTL